MIDKVNATEFGPDEFDREYYQPETKQPVLIKGEVAEWEATQRWDPEYLDCMLGHREVNVKFLEEGVLSLNHPENVEEKTVPFSEARRLICEHGNYYLAQTTIKYPLTTRVVNGVGSDVSILGDDLQKPRYLGDVSKQCFVTNLWFGGDLCKTPLHFDNKGNFFVQILGKKKFLLFSPSQTDKLYQAHGTEHSHLSRINVFDPDESKFPRYTNAEGAEVIVKPGDMLYIPRDWWHAVETLETSISVNFWWTSLVEHVKKQVEMIYQRCIPPLRALLRMHPF